VCVLSISDSLLEEVAFIDYEYGAFNYRSFDVANHFCEYAGFDCDYSKYPTPEYRWRWIRIYLQEWSRLSDTKQDEHHHIDAMFREVSIFTLAAHFFWGLWGLAQAQNSDIEFDYMNYACLRFSQYEQQKHILPDI
jgi:ethanolamine kinase